MSLQLSDSILETLLLERRIVARDISKIGPIWELGIADGDAPEPDSDDVLYVARLPAPRAGWQVQTGQLEDLSGRIPPEGIRYSCGGRMWFVDAEPDPESLEGIKPP